MKGKFVATLFALPFLTVGVWMLWSVGSAFVDAWHRQEWVAAEGRLARAGYTTNSGSDAVTYEAYAEYSYRYNGVTCRGDRVSLSRGGDNIGDYQQQTGSRLKRAAAEGAAITVFVDPESPDESIIDRNLRWGLVGFKSVFLIVFGGVGLGVLFLLSAGQRPAKTPACPSTCSLRGSSTRHGRRQPYDRVQGTRCGAHGRLRPSGT